MLGRAAINFTSFATRVLLSHERCTIHARFALVPLIWRVNRPSSFCQDERFGTCKQPSTQQEPLQPLVPQDFPFQYYHSSAKAHNRPEASFRPVAGLCYFHMTAKSNCFCCYCCCCCDCRSTPTIKFATSTSDLCAVTRLTDQTTPPL